MAPKASLAKHALDSVASIRVELADRDSSKIQQDQMSFVPHDDLELGDE
jgi:hypothetical protein